MKGTAAQVRTHERSVQLLMVNQFTISGGFSMLWQIPPGHTGAPLEHDALKDLAVIAPPAPGAAHRRQQRLDHRPSSVLVKPASRGW